MSLARDKFFWQSFSRHAQHTLDAATQLVHMLEDSSQRERLAANVKELEHCGDQITHDTVQALHQTWITPLDREEIHGLISALDDVLDFTEAASDRIALYEIADVRPEAVELAKVLEAAAQDIFSAVSMLFELKEPKRLLAVCKSIGDRERAADQIFRGALARLFKERGDLLEIIKWRDIFDALESATDRAEDVANVIEGIVLEHG
jgi:predicted phosphate transport protein (TIGR00153 family)